MVGISQGMTTTTLTFAAALKQALYTKGCTQKDLAISVGKDVSTVSLWVAGRHRPRLDDRETIEKLAEFLGQEPAAVRALLTASQESDAEHRAGSSKHFRIPTTIEDCERIFAGEPDLLDRILPEYIRSSIPGIQEKLEERGVSIHEALLRKFLHGHIVPGTPSRNQDHQGIIRHEEKRPTPRQIEKTWLRDRIRQLCPLLNDVFAMTDNEELPRTEVLRHMDAILINDSRPKQMQISSQEILKKIQDLKLLVDSSNGMIRRKWALRPDFIINSSWGIQPQIPGLDFLLDGGLHLPSSGGLSILIQGSPGAGKTSLALQLAASIAFQGCALYLSAEESLSRLIERLSFSGYAYRQVSSDTVEGIMVREGKEFSLKTWDFVAQDPISDIVNSELKKGRGVLFLISIPNRRDFQDQGNPLLHNLHLLFEKFFERNIPSCFVLDSTDAVLQNEERRLYENLFAYASHSVGIFTSEERYEERQLDERLIRAHLVDIVIELSHRVGLDNSSHRTIEIRKSRTQNHIRGQHLFSIHAGQGFHVYPSIQSILSVWKRRIRKGIISEPEEWQVEGLNFNEGLLREDVDRGSALLLTGPQATHKLPISLTFLASVLEKEKDAQVLLLSLRDDETSLIDIIKTYPQLHKLLGKKKHSLNPNLRVLYHPPAYFTPAWFIDWIRQNLKNMKKSSKKIRRIVFHNLNQLRYSSPFSAEESLFVSALLELFRKEQITALFVQVQGDAQSHDVFDTILSTDYGPTDDPDLVEFRVGHTTRCDASRDGRWLRRIRDEARGTGWLEFVQKPAMTLLPDKPSQIGVVTNPLTTDPFLSYY